MLCAFRTCTILNRELKRNCLAPDDDPIDLAVSGVHNLGQTNQQDGSHGCVRRERELELMSSLLYRWNATVAPTAFLLNNHRLHARCISLGSEQEQLAKKYISKIALYFLRFQKGNFLLTFTMKKTWKHEKPKKVYYVVHTAPIIIGISSHKNNPIIFLVRAATVYVWLTV